MGENNQHVIIKPWLSAGLFFQGSNFHHGGCFWGQTAFSLSDGYQNNDVNRSRFRRTKTDFYQEETGFDCKARRINMLSVSRGRCKLFSCKCKAIFYLRQHLFYLESLSLAGALAV